MRSVDEMEFERRDKIKIRALEEIAKLLRQILVALDPPKQDSGLWP